MYTRLKDEVRYVAVGGGVLDGEGWRGKSSFLIGGNDRHVRFPFEALNKCCHEPLNPEALLARKKNTVCISTLFPLFAFSKYRDLIYMRKQ